MYEAFNSGYLVPESVLSIPMICCFQIPLRHLLAVWFWANYLTSQDLFFLL